MAKKSSAKKLRYEILPHQGIGPVRLGMSRQEVADVLEDEPGAMPLRSHGDRDIFFRSSFQVSFSPTQTVEFIETASSDSVTFFFEGVNVHKLSANKLLEHIKKFDQPLLGGAERDSYPLFPKLVLALGERRTGPSHWDAVGVGDKRYLEWHLKRLETPFERPWSRDTKPLKSEAKVVAWLHDELGYRPEMDKKGRARRLDMFYCGPKRKLVDDDFKQFAKFKWLEALGTQVQKEITNTAITHISGLTRLKGLKIAATNLDDGMLKDLVKLSTLEELNLPGHITAKGLKKLTKLKELRTLDLDLLPEAELGLAHLSRLPELHTLRVSGELTNIGMKYIKDIPRLTELGISDTKVTNAGLKHLEHCAHLKVLKRWSSKTTSTAALKLRKKLPLLEIHPSAY